MGRVYQSFLERKGQRNQDDIRKQVQGRVCPETLARYRRLLETDLAPK
jgi:hypothetical protein